MFLHTNETWSHFLKGQEGQHTPLKLLKLLNYYCMRGGHSHVPHWDSKAYVQQQTLRKDVNEYIAKMCKDGLLREGTTLEDIANAKSFKELTPNES